MAQAARMFGFEGTSHDVARHARRRLKAIAANDPSFMLFKPAGTQGWHTTIQDLRRVIPELFANDPDESSDLIDALDEMRERLERATRRLERLERVQFVNTATHATAPKMAQQGMQQ
jgi:hypothetical protein